jgi:hypothetical protein
MIPPAAICRQSSRRRNVYSTVALAAALAGTVAACRSVARLDGANATTHEIAARQFTLALPKGFVVHSKLSDTSSGYIPYYWWVRWPWSPGILMERRYANAVIVAFLDDNSLAALQKHQGGIYIPPYFDNTLSSYHASIKVYASELARRPLLVRYDLKTDGGRLCFAASIDRHENARHEEDLQEILHALRNFSAIPPAGR